MVPLEQESCFHKYENDCKHDNDFFETFNKQEVNIKWIIF